MRRFTSTVLAAATIGLLATACGGQSPTSGTGASPNTVSRGATTQAVPSPTAATVDPTLLDRANPCTVINPSDLTKVFGGTWQLVSADGYDPSNPPVTGSDTERNCAYNNGSFTVQIKTDIDSANGGPVWQAFLQMSTQGISVRPLTGLGDGAFFTQPGTLYAHKGRVIVEVNSPDDVNNTMTDDAARRLLISAFSHPNLQSE